MANGGGATSGYKKVMCKYFQQGQCKQMDSCTFAHGVHELQGGFDGPKSGFKTQLCKFWETQGSCIKGNHCPWAHGAHELAGNHSVSVGRRGGGDEPIFNSWSAREGNTTSAMLTDAGRSSARYGGGVGDLLSSLVRTAQSSQPSTAGFGAGQIPAASAAGPSGGGAADKNATGLAALTALLALRVGSMGAGGGVGGNSPGAGGFQQPVAAGAHHGGGVHSGPGGFGDALRSSGMHSGVTGDPSNHLRFGGTIGGAQGSVLPGISPEVNHGLGHGQGQCGVSSVYKRVMCRFYALGGSCPQGSACTFAHGPTELQGGSGLPRTGYKTQMCRFFDSGTCVKGRSCGFAHGFEELQGNALLHGQDTVGASRMDVGNSAPLSSGFLQHGEVTFADSQRQHDGNDSTIGVDIGGCTAASLHSGGEVMQHTAATSGSSCCGASIGASYTQPSLFPNCSGDSTINSNPAVAADFNMQRQVLLQNILGVNLGDCGGSSVSGGSTGGGCGGGDVGGSLAPTLATVGTESLTTSIASVTGAVAESAASQLPLSAASVPQALGSNGSTSVETNAGTSPGPALGSMSSEDASLHQVLQTYGMSADALAPELLKQLVDNIQRESAENVATGA
eukprot:TRINITY_DN56139_c0_g1_i1.p1 TRINITY_DN56139_c0_g1~~TRINITY_DN56139_c0_g1_i1.p1  ORF type:complete len:713 (+),score=107.23 TRINITY_DN56139_c0_g1_i1:282-2141(+)